MKRTDIRRAVTKIRDRDALLAAQLRGQRQSAADRHTGADHAGGHHAAALRMSHMHRPALALAGAGAAAGKFRPNELRRHALGDHVVNTTIDRDQIVLVGQLHADGRRNAFLAARRVVRHDHLAGLHQADKAVVVQLDLRHLAIDGHQGAPIRQRTAHTGSLFSCV